MRRRILAANWKMYKTPSQATEFVDQLRAHWTPEPDEDVVVFPPAICLPALAEAASGKHVQVGGQNMHWEREGAFTGEISGEMLRSVGATWVLVGHSERRQFFCETDTNVLRKTQAALAVGLKPIVCVGERLEEHQSGQAHEVLIRQFAAGVAGLREEEFARVAMAYEPIWAIGTGQTATPEIASEAHQVIRAEAAKRYGTEAAEQLHIVYGGSVKPDNIAGLMAEPAIDGVLVGGASLDPLSFARIITGSRPR